MSTFTIDTNGNLVGGGTAPLVGIPAIVDFTNGVGSVEAAQVIPLLAVPSQIVFVTLGNQAVSLKVYGKQTYVPFQPSGSIITQPPAYVQDFPVFIDIYLNDSPIVLGTLCSNKVPVIRNTYFGFKGDFSFLDTQGNSDPLTTGIGSRWLLCYWPGLI